MNGEEVRIWQKIVMEAPGNGLKTEWNHKGPQSGDSIAQPRFASGTSGMQVETFF